MYAPMLYPMLGLVAGILAGGAGLPWWCAPLLILAAIIAYLALLRMGRNPLRGFKTNKWHHAWILLVFAGIGLLDMEFQRPFVLEQDPSGIIAIQGRVVGVSSRTSGDRAEIEVEGVIWQDGRSQKTSNCRMLLRSDALSCAADDYILAKGSVSEIIDAPNYLHEGYSKRLRNKGFLYQVDSTGDDVEILSHSRTISGYALSLRESLEAGIEKTRLEKSTQNFLITILLGDRDYLDQDTRSLYADAGLSHMLALSGMHVSIIAGIVMWLLFPINFAGLFKFRYLIAALIMVLYAFLTGLAPSTVRATLMMLAVTIALFLERRNSAWNSLLLATFCILLITPSALFDAGLQLSFVCVAALIFFVRPLNPFSQHEHPKFYKVAGVLLTTLVATCATWCISAYYFGTVPLLFLPANLIALPLLPPYLVVAIIYFAFTAIGMEPSQLALVVDIFPDTLGRVVSYITDVGGTTLRFTPTELSVWIWMALMVCVAMALKGEGGKKMRYAGMVLACGFVVAIAASADADKPNTVIQSNIYKLAVVTLRNGREEMIELPRYALSATTINGTRIAAIDCPLPTIPNTLTAATPCGTLTATNGQDMPTPAAQCDSRMAAMQCDILILGGGAVSGVEDLSAMIETIRSRYIFKKLVIHPTIRREKEEQLLTYADSIAIPTYSIRRSGPLRLHL